LWLACLFAAAFYSITEAGFRLLNPMWIFLLLSIVYSSGIARDYLGALQPADTAPKKELRPLAKPAWQIARTSGRTKSGHLVSAKRP
jgi:hypothetical protein